MTDGYRALLEKLVEVLISRRGADPQRDRFKSLENIEDAELRKRQAAWYFLEEKILFVFMLVIACGLTCAFIYIAVFSQQQPSVSVYILAGLMLIVASLWRRIIAKL